MTIDLFTFVGMFDRALATADHLLARGLAHAEANGATGADMLGWRLIDDMHPLRFQISTVCNFAQRWPARVAGLEVPGDIDGEQDVAGFRADLAKARAYLGTLTPGQFAGRDEVPLTFAIGPMEPTLPAGRWLSGFATANVYFHLSIAYAILRGRGVPLGKVDMFPAGL